MTLVTGAELFTGNTALVTAAVLEKKATLKQRAGSCIRVRGSQRTEPAPSPHRALGRVGLAPLPATSAYTSGYSSAYSSACPVCLPLRLPLIAR